MRAPKAAWHGSHRPRRLHDSSRPDAGRTSGEHHAPVWDTALGGADRANADDMVQRGIAYLRDRQQNGTWPEAHYTGTGFPRDFYINYHLYRHLFPLMALANDESRHTRGITDAEVALSSRA